MTSSQTGFGLRTLGSGPTLLLLFALCGGLFIGCGRKGPPLPPLVYAPAAVAEFTAKRAGGDIVLHFKIPTTNTSGASPADLERIEVYAHTGPLPAPADFLKYGTLIGSIAVKAPETAENPQSGEKVDDKGQKVEDKGQTAEGHGQDGIGVEQGAAASIREPMTPALLEPGKLPYVRPAAPAAATAVVEALETPGTVNLPPPVMRYYVVQGISRKNKKGAFAGPLGVPISTDLPKAPTAANVTYKEDAISVTWTPAEGAPPQFNVYEVAEPAAGDAASTAVRAGAPPVLPANTDLLKTPSFTDTVTFGTRKCYVVRTLARAGAVALESEPTAPVCVTPVDTFPPAAPKQLASVSDEKGVNLIWEPNTERDLAGYIVLRGEAPGETLKPLTAEPIHDASFRDENVQPGHTYIYAVVAIDTATPPNRSEESNRQTEVIR